MSRRVAEPKPVTVDAGADGAPHAVDNSPVEAIREDWLIEDSWWSPAPVRRRYFDLLLGSGRRVVVFCDLVTGRWWRQRA